MITVISAQDAVARDNFSPLSVSTYLSST